MACRSTLMARYGQWREAAALARAKRAVLTRILGHLLNTYVGGAFRLWRGSLADEKRRALVLARFSARMRNAFANRVMQTWRDTADERKRQRVMLERCRSRILRRCELAMLSRWCQYVEERCAARALVKRIVGRVVLGAVGGAFFQLRDETHAAARAQAEQAQATLESARCDAARKAEQDIAERLLKRERAVAAIARLHGDALRSTLIAWRTHVKREKRLRKLTAEFALKWHRQVEVRSFAAWLDFVDERIYQRTLLRRVLGGKAHGMVLCAWRVWREDVADHALCLAKQRASAIDEIEAQLASESSSTASLVATLEVRRLVVRAPPGCARRPAFMTNQNHSERVLLQLWALLPRRNVPPRVRRHSATLLDSSRCGSMQLWCLVLRRGRSFWLTSVSSRLALARSYRR